MFARATGMIRTSGAGVTQAEADVLVVISSVEKAKPGGSQYVPPILIPGALWSGGRTLRKVLPGDFIIIPIY